jgi:hypothetical protein
MLAIGGFLQRVEVMLGRLSRTSADPLVLLDVGKVDTSGAGLYGCFSLCSWASLAVTALFMQIMPKLLELYGDVIMIPSAVDWWVPPLAMPWYVFRQFFS